MEQTVSALKVRRNLGELLNRNFSALNKIWKKTKGIKLTERDIKETIQKVRAGKK